MAGHTPWQDVKTARQHIDAAMQALGIPEPLAGEPELVRQAVERVRMSRPGVSSHQAAAVIEALRAMGWGPSVPVAAQEARTCEPGERGPLPPLPDSAYGPDAVPLPELPGPEGI
jgi:hypothetical protein